MSRLWLATPLGESPEMFEHRHGTLLFANNLTGPIKQKVPCISKVPCMAKIDWLLVLLQLLQGLKTLPRSCKFYRKQLLFKYSVLCFSAQIYYFGHKQTPNFWILIDSLRTLNKRSTEHLARSIYIS